MTEFSYIKEYRATGMGGLTIPVAICLTCREVVYPYYKRMSRRGTHGNYYFRHQHELSFIEFYQSNKTHNRSYSIEGPKESWMEKIGQAWNAYTIHSDALTTYIDMYLSETSPEGEMQHV